MAQGLTDAAIANAIKEAKVKERPVIVRDTGKTTGLQAVASYGGTVTFSLLYTPRGEAKPRRLKLGRMRPGFGIVQARLEVGRIRAEMNDGLDPVIAREHEAARQRAALEVEKAAEAARKAEAETLARRITVDRLAELYFAARSREGGMERSQQLYSRSIGPVIGAVVVADIKKTDIQRMVDDVASRGNTTQPQRALEVLRPMLKWAIEREYLQAEKDGIWRKLKLPEAGEPRERVLTAREIRWLWQQTDKWMRFNPNVSRIVRLDILLGQRSSETCELEREEISDDFLFWTIPGARTKNGKPHRIPLPPLARSVLQEAISAMGDRRGNVFLGKRGKIERADSISHEVADAIWRWNTANPEDEIERFVVHDLRRTMASRLEETGTSMTVIETCLNHISGKSSSVTRRHYAHGDQSAMMRHALAKWEALVQQCISGSDPFATSLDDIAAIEARAFAEANGGKPRLASVSRLTL